MTSPNLDGRSGVTVYETYALCVVMLTSALRVTLRERIAGVGDFFFQVVSGLLVPVLVERLVQSHELLRREVRVKLHVVRHGRVFRPIDLKIVRR